MKRILAALVVLAAVAPSRAQDMFGISPDQVSGLVAQAQAQQREDYLRSLGWEPSNLPSIGRALGLREKPASRQDCIYDAVSARLGADANANVEFPAVLYAVHVDLSRYQAAYKSQFPGKPAPDSVQTAYLPNYDVIYLDDLSSDYRNGATIDAALAGQYARFIDGTVRSISDQARIDADAAAVQAWYQTQYPAGASSCAN
ncbi:MAG: hypothetical protein HKL90_02735 [Elusimicrobia bacterium]|nr:hypothetical protein [Elusimicrobiota bacterium]